ncbi:hypothetical protein BV25DRAFT_1922717 [Artomyces pyxidatus]|uniref:Uncharacterized protein n=1 Tax=Artomyces pyxidatus TaxID=48021 RepID=A0ACB8SET3_9AGAM|nr:hypothetical protein BV25DRAFT_1922717 [Artomyces pyxidatus]
MPYTLVRLSSPPLLTTSTSAGFDIHVHRMPMPTLSDTPPLPIARLPWPSRMTCRQLTFIDHPSVIFLLLSTVWAVPTPSRTHSSSTPLDRHVPRPQTQRKLVVTWLSVAPPPASRTFFPSSTPSPRQSPLAFVAVLSDRLSLHIATPSTPASKLRSSPPTVLSGYTAPTRERRRTLTSSYTSHSWSTPADLTDTNTDSRERHGGGEGDRKGRRPRAGGDRPAEVPRRPQTEPLQCFLADCYIDGVWTRKGQQDFARIFLLSIFAAKHSHRDLFYRVGTCCEDGWDMHRARRQYPCGERPTSCPAR